MLRGIVIALCTSCDGRKLLQSCAIRTPESRFSTRSTADLTGSRQLPDTRKASQAGSTEIEHCFGDGRQPKAICGSFLLRTSYWGVSISRIPWSPRLLYQVLCCLHRYAARNPQTDQLDGVYASNSTSWLQWEQYLVGLRSVGAVKQRSAQSRWPPSPRRPWRPRLLVRLPPRPISSLDPACSPAPHHGRAQPLAHSRPALGSGARP